MVILSKINDNLAKFEKFIIFVLNFIILTNIFIQVVCRYVLYIPTPWAEEVALYSFIWLSWIGSGFAQYTGDHLRINIMDTISQKLSKNPKKMMQRIDMVAMLVTIITLIWFFIIEKEFFIRMAVYPQIAPVTGMPLTIVQVSILIGIAFMLFHTVTEFIIKTISLKKNSKH